MTTDPTRRTVLRSAGAVGAGAAAVGALAACGSGSTASPGGAASQVASQAAAGALAKAADIPVGGGKIIDKVVVTQPTAGTFKAFSSACTHKGCPVNSVADGKITCACHGSVFDAATGAVVTGPATSALPEKKVTVSNGSITVS